MESGNQDKTAAQMLYGGDAAKPTGNTSGEAPTIVELLYGKEAPKEQPAKEQRTENQNSEDKGKDWLQKGAEDAAKADRYDLKLPEGAVIVDDALMRDFTKLGRENGFTNEQMQRFADLHLRANGELIRQAAEYREVGERRYDEVQGWEQEFKGDNEFGGSNAEQTLTQARKALNAFGTVEEVKRLKAEFDRTGLGSHPVLIRGLARVARLIDSGEDD